MIKLAVFILLVGAVIHEASCCAKCDAKKNVLGVVPERASLYDPNKPFTCLDGSKTIPFSQINDDYCDCNDASDEPGTSACLNGQFACENLGYIVQMIPSGRVADGICDCCDGSDETNYILSNSKCENTCNALALQMKEEDEKMKVLTEHGLTKKKELIEQGNQIKKSIEEAIEALQVKRDDLQTEKSRLEGLKKEAEAKANTAKAAQDAVFEEQRAELKKKETAQKSRALFDLLDLDKDTYLTSEELLSHSELDILFDNDGTFTLEEAAQFFDSNGKVAYELFAESYYEKIVPHLIETPAENKETTDASITEGSEESDEELLGDDGNDNDDEEEETSEEPIFNTYDDETQRLIDESNKISGEFDEADRSLSSADRELSEKRGQLQFDLGPENEFAAMLNTCFEYQDREYIYKLCPFSKTVQQSRSSKSDTSIGNWIGWGQEDGNASKYMSMSFQNGLACWNGPQRSTIVHLTCGLENKVTSVTEPNKCEYEMVFETPAVCAEFKKVNGHEEL